MKSKHIGSVHDYPDKIEVELREDGAIVVSLGSHCSIVLNYFSAKELAEYLNMAVEEIEKPSHPFEKAYDRMIRAKAYLRRAQSILTDYYRDTWDERADMFSEHVGRLAFSLENMLAILHGLWEEAEK